MTQLARLLEACEPARSAVAGSVLTTLGWIKFGAAQHAHEKKFYARHLPACANSPPNATALEGTSPPESVTWTIATMLGRHEPLDTAEGRRHLERVLGVHRQE